MRLLENLAETDEPQEIDQLAEAMKCDSRTIRRDLDALQQLLQHVQGLEIRRGRVHVARSSHSPGYFTNQLERNSRAKERIARAVVAKLPDDVAIVLTAGSTPFAVAREMRRVAVQGGPPNNLIVFTNSVPALLELASAGIATGALGEIYSPEDCALHTPDFHTAFQPSIAIVGASGVLFGPQSSQAALDLFSHRAEEAAFLKQLLAGVPEIIIAADSSKLGRRHPWSFGGPVLAGKTVRLITDVLSDAQKQDLSLVCDRFKEQGTQFTFEESCEIAD
jgi:DeoR family glycerol-3-phosphate regulon repressor